MASQFQSACSAESLQITADGYPELCAAARQQAIKLLKRDRSTCAFPYQNGKDGIEPIQWITTTDDQAQRAWSDFLARVYWDKGVNSDYDQFWNRNRPVIANTLENGGSLEKAELDVDNDGLPDTVYRATTIRPVDQSDTLKGWSILACRGQLPYHSIFFARDQWTRMGNLAVNGSAESAELFRYRGRTYWILSGSDIFSISAIGRTSIEPTEAYAEQVCAFLVN